MEDAMRQSDNEEQARVLEEALTLSLADAVFMIVHYNLHYRWSHREPIELSILHDRHDPSEVEEWRLKALKLRADAYSVGDALLHNYGTYDRLRGELEAAYPGFNQNTYFEAVSYGSFCAR
jgi:hypothetical protein